MSLLLSSLLELALSPLIFHQSHTTCLSTKNKAPLQCSSNNRKNGLRRRETDVKHQSCTEKYVKYWKFWNIQAIKINARCKNICKTCVLYINVCSYFIILIYTIYTYKQILIKCIYSSYTCALYIYSKCLNKYMYIHMLMYMYVYVYAYTHTHTTHTHTHTHTLTFIQTFRIYICTCITSVYTLYMCVCVSHISFTYTQIWFIYFIYSIYKQTKQMSLYQTDFTHFLGR